MGDLEQDSVTRLVNIQPEDILAGELAALLGLLCLYAGYAYPIGALLGRAFPRPKVEWTHQTAQMVAVTMIPIGWVVFFELALFNIFIAALMLAYPSLGAGMTLFVGVPLLLVIAAIMFFVTKSVEGKRKVKVT